MVDEPLGSADKTCSLWTAEGIEFGDDWHKVYEMAFQVTGSTRLQSIVHRYFPSREFLYTRRVIEDPLCDNCGEVESLQHYFFECSYL